MGDSDLLCSSVFDSARSAPTSISAASRLGHVLLSGGREPHPHSFSPGQMEACASVCDAIFPSVPYDDDAKDSEAVKSFYDLTASDAGVPAKFAGLVCKFLDPSAVALLSLIMWLLSYRLGTLLLAGRFCFTSKFPFILKFSELPLAQKQRILRGWALSHFLILQIAFKLFKSLSCVVYFGEADAANKNKSWDAIGYTGPDPRHKAHFEERISKQLYDDTRPLANHVFDLQEAAENGVNGVEKVLLGAGCSLLDNIANFKQLHRARGGEKSSKSLGIECDVVIVGSGSGGGVLAGVLAQAGYKVVVLEKGHYFARQDLSLVERPTWEAMFEAGGLVATDDGAVNIIAGSTVGGGSAINWSASFKTPPHVIREWSHDMNLKLFESAEYQQAMEAICKRQGVQTEVNEESQQNVVLRRGCEKLGYPVGTIPRNAAADHSCGWCCLGCWDGKKQATSETWLVDAIQAGAVILAGCRAEAVLHDAIDGNGTSAKSRKARGVVATIPANGKPINLFIQARATVVACGSLNTPPLLLKSGFKNPNIGKHLHIHPAAMVWGYFPDLPRPHYEGPIMTAFSNVCANWDTSGYGALLQTPTMHPGGFAAVTPWVSGLDFKNRMTRYARTVHLLVLCRDTSSGSVSVASHSGGPNVHYKVNRLDGDHLMDGQEKALRVLIAAGAAVVGTQQFDGECFQAQSASPEEINAYLDRVKQRALSNPLGSAHQMGTCRMGVDPKSSVVDPRGEAWEAEGLFLGDASVFPGASGVNPMITVQSIAYCTANSVKAFLKLEPVSRLY